MQQPIRETVDATVVEVKSLLAWHTTEFNLARVAVTEAGEALDRAEALRGRFMAAEGAYREAQATLGRAMARRERHEEAVKALTRTIALVGQLERLSRGIGR